MEMITATWKITGIFNADAQKVAEEINKIGDEWFVKPNNFIKVLEGNYNDLHETGTTQKPERRPKQYTTAEEYRPPKPSKTVEELKALVEQI